MNINEKKIALDALFYEVWMLNETFHLLSLSHLHPTSFVSPNANLESFLTHARNVVYFLENRKDSRDIRCSDFGAAGIDVNLPAGNGIHEINKYLSHLTKERISIPKPKWECEKIKEEINEKIKQFIANLDQTIFPTARGKDGNDFIKISS
ncbi:MAG TPA: hypothetical protein ENH90_01150 [bacterium]|nr:hypothetical protein [bacterium]